MIMIAILLLWASWALFYYIISSHAVFFKKNKKELLPITCVRKRVGPFHFLEKINREYYYDYYFPLLVVSLAAMMKSFHRSNKSTIEDHFIACKEF